MMRNHHPIFVNGFSRGGTTILTNLLASHPDVCLLGEIHHVFKGARLTDSPWRVLRKCVQYDAPMILSQAEDFFSPRRVKPRKPLRRWAERHVDTVLYQEKLRSRHAVLNQFKNSSQAYSTSEIAQARMLGKNIDGMIYATDAWSTMYPDATFFGLVRNGLAVCEGHVRRGRSPDEIGWRYKTLVSKMLDDAERLPRYRILRFEDMIRSPWETLQDACDVAGLDVSDVGEVRMQTRRVMDADGIHRLHGKSEWQLVWLRRDQLTTYFQPDVDANQIKRLKPDQRDAFLRRAGTVMDRLGYDAGTQVSQASEQQAERDLQPVLLPLPLLGDSQPVSRKAA